MKAAEFIDLVRRMRSAQKFYYKLDPRDRDKKLNALIASKQLEKQVDDATIDDIHNLVTESPIA
jgi:hypothetical protein